MCNYDAFTKQTPTQMLIYIFLILFKHTGYNTPARLVISVRGNQPATHGMSQRQIKNGFRKPARQNAKLLLKLTISDFRDISSYTALTELAKQSLI